jgi:hypothetical protein
MDYIIQLYGDENFGEVMGWDEDFPWFGKF